MRAKPGLADEVAQALRELRAYVKENEPYVLEYSFARDGDVIAIWERYENKQAIVKWAPFIIEMTLNLGTNTSHPRLISHAQGDLIKAFQVKLKDLLVEVRWSIRLSESHLKSDYDKPPKVQIFPGEL